jgi:hypothetical protein
MSEVRGQRSEVRISDCGLRIFKKAGRGHKSEAKDQTSEVRVKLISDLRLLTSVMDDFNDLNDLPL